MDIYQLFHLYLVLQNLLIEYKNNIPMGAQVYYRINMIIQKYYK